MTINFWGFWIGSGAAVEDLEGEGGVEFSDTNYTQFDVALPVDDSTFAIDKVRVSSARQALGSGDKLYIFDEDVTFDPENAYLVESITPKSFDLAHMAFSKQFYGTMLVSGQPDTNINIHTWRTVSGVSFYNNQTLPPEYTAAEVSLGTFGADVYCTLSYDQQPDLYSYQIYRPSSYEVKVQPEPQEEVLSPAWYLVRRPAGYIKYNFMCAKYKHEVYRSAIWKLYTWMPPVWTEQAWVDGTSLTYVGPEDFTVYFYNNSSDSAVAINYAFATYINPYSINKRCAPNPYWNEFGNIGLAGIYGGYYRWKFVYKRYTVITCPSEGHWQNTGSNVWSDTQPPSDGNTRWVKTAEGYWTASSTTVTSDTQPVAGPGESWNLYQASTWVFADYVETCTTPVNTSTDRYTVYTPGYWLYESVIYSEIPPTNTDMVTYTAAYPPTWMRDTGGLDPTWRRELVQAEHWEIKTPDNEMAALATRWNTPPAGWRLPTSEDDLGAMTTREIVSAAWLRWEGAQLTDLPEGQEGVQWRRSLRLAGWGLPVYRLVNSGAMMVSIDQGSYVLRYDPFTGVLKTDELMKRIAYGGTFINNEIDEIDTSLIDGGWYIVLPTDEYGPDFDGGFFPENGIEYEYILDGEFYDGILNIGEIDGGRYPVDMSDVYGIDFDGGEYPSDDEPLYTVDGEFYNGTPGSDGGRFPVLANDVYGAPVDGGSYPTTSEGSDLDGDHY